ncbi:Zinc transporter ZIP11 [Liparis tanakae]|uniref:Zinc transporter ZIP11 n=1 Tax=Liparis tanakae TaxID=230148 RepID=A0A4Z2FMX6_9TELE|nr:Zinc transporter ZIP11 [Liparis tanakae]
MTPHTHPPGSGAMLEGYSPVSQALLGTLFTWGLTAAGAAMVFVFSGRQGFNPVEALIAVPCAGAAVLLMIRGRGHARPEEERELSIQSQSVGFPSVNPNMFLMTSGLERFWVQ